MQMDIITLLRGTTQAIGAWRYSADRNGQFFTVDEQGSQRPSEESWKRLAIKINQLAYSNAHMPVDVFLYLRERLIESLYNYGHLENVVNAAHNHAWGGNVYVAWDQQADTAFSSLYPENEAALEKWFRGLTRSGVTDLIEIPKRTREKAQDEYKILRACALAAEDRREKLRRLVSDDGWVAVLRDEAHFLEEFTRHCLGTDVLPSRRENQVVFYDRRPRRGLAYMVEKSRDSYRGGRRFVAVAPGIDSRDLEGLWRQESLAMKPVQFNGTFEWLYTVIRLNQASRHLTLVPVSGSSPDYVEAVEPSGSMRFRLEPEDTDLRLLVTSAFHPFQDPSHCIGAAREIGTLVRSLPFHIDVKIHPCITCERLPDVLEAQPLTAWLHLSHGDRAEGLYEAQTKQYASPDRWLNCFNTYRGSMQLVILSACESASIARSFAASGARVAIGFESEVLTAATRNLTERVVPAALQTGDRQNAIVAAFREACCALSSRTYSQGAYIDALPKAFSFNLRSL